MINSFKFRTLHLSHSSSSSSFGLSAPRRQCSLRCAGATESVPSAKVARFDGRWELMLQLQLPDLDVSAYTASLKHLKSMEFGSLSKSYLT